MLKSVGTVRSQSDGKNGSPTEGRRHSLLARVSIVCSELKSAAGCGMRMFSTMGAEAGFAAGCKTSLGFEAVAR